MYTLPSGLVVCTLFPCLPRKMVYTIPFFALWPRGRATDREKRGATVVVYTLFLRESSSPPCDRQKAPGGTSRKFGGVRAEVSGKGPRLLRSCLGVEISRRNPPKQTSKKFTSEPPKLLRSPSRSGSMGKLVLALSYFFPGMALFFFGDRARMMFWRSLGPLPKGPCCTRNTTT